MINAKKRSFLQCWAEWLPLEALHGAFFFGEKGRWGGWKRRCRFVR
jgi:hypothetical protein